MSMNQPSKPQVAPKVDHNRETWCVFHKDDKEAQEALERITKKLSETHLIVSAKIIFTTKFHDGNIYKVDIVKAKKN